MTSRAFIVAGTHSGSGKTTVTLSLMAAFRSRNCNVQGFKVGPDYIDPSLHKIITGKPSINLDSWMIPGKFLNWTFARHAKNADINIIEGVMGLYDSRTATTDDGSTAEVAKKLGVPVILVINAASMARSVAALVKGFADFDPGVNIAGVILNNVGSGRHLKFLSESVTRYCDIPVIGGFPRENNISIPSRHLGLFMGQDNVLKPGMIEKLSELARENLNLELIEKISEVSLPECEEPAIRPIFRRPKKLAVAMDNAFCFYYRDNLDILEQLGLKLTFFSPVEDKTLPDDIHAVYFGGGYPELYAEKLAKNDGMKNSIREFHKQNGWIYAECGGLMYLGKEIENPEGITYKMCGLFPFKTRVLKKLKSLGYVEIEPVEDFLFLKKGKPVRGHEFHYSEISKISPDIKNIYISNPVDKSRGYRIRNTLASYAHLHLSRLLY